ncbi:MAG: biotin transporter BioY [Bacteroidota bacterium]
MLTIAIAARVSIDVGNIPITGQTLAILAWAFFLSPVESLVVISGYLVLGFIGLPVFADGESGFDKLFGGSGGYLIGFLIASIIVSWLNQKWRVNSFSSILVLTLIGTIIILVFGVGRLITIYDLQKGIQYGFLPFWKGALIKIILGSFIVWRIKKLLAKR